MIGLAIVAQINSPPRKCTFSDLIWPESHKLSKRDETIYQEFNGINHSELARKYGVSLQWIYKIVKAVQKEEMAKRQPDMFGT